MFDEDASFEARWDKTIDINLTALAIFIRACVPALLKSNAGRIINIASTEHFVTGPGNVAYSATKSAVTGLTRSFAVELGKYQNITVSCAEILYEMKNRQSNALDASQVNTICPGPIIVSSGSLVPFSRRIITRLVNADRHDRTNSA